LSWPGKSAKRAFALCARMTSSGKEHIAWLHSEQHGAVISGAALMRRCEHPKLIFN
jgi:hypothetical protein